MTDLWGVFIKIANAGRTAKDSSDHDIPEQQPTERRLSEQSARKSLGNERTTSCSPKRVVEHPTRRTVFGSLFSLR